MNHDSAKGNRPQKVGRFCFAQGKLELLLFIFEIDIIIEIFEDYSEKEKNDGNENELE